MNAIHFKHWKNILISRFYEQFSQNGSAMAPERAVRKNFKLLKYEHIIYHFKENGLEISNVQYNYFREIFKFRENMSENRVAKFLKVFIKWQNCVLSEISTQLYFSVLNKRCQERNYMLYSVN